MIAVEIQNFQSIEKVKLRIEGFTVLVGQSNIGKSAVVRAIRCALTGAAGTDFVRHGDMCTRRIKGNKKCRCQTTVMLETSKMKVTWEKGDAVNQYTVTQDGEEVLYTAVDRGTPEFLTPEFSPFKIGSSAPDLIQVSEQFRPIFLLDQSGPATADVLSDVARLDHINKAIGMVNKDRKSAVATRKVREKDVLRIQKTLDGYEGLDKDVERAQTVEQRYKAIETAQKGLVQLDQYIEALTTQAASVRALMAATEPSLPVAKALVEKGKTFTKLVALYEKLVAKAPAFRKLLGVGKVVLPDAEPVETKSVLAQRLDKWWGQLETFKVVGRQTKALKAVKLPGAVKDTTKELSKLDRFIERHAKQREATKQTKALKAAKVPKLKVNTHDLDQLQGFLDRQAACSEQLVDLESRFPEAETELEVVLGEFSELGLCPTCTQDINVDHRHTA